MNEEKRLFIENTCTLIVQMLRLLDSNSQKQVIGMVTNQIEVESGRSKQPTNAYSDCCAGTSECAACCEVIVD
jgi:hypothetical protein